MKILVIQQKMIGDVLVSSIICNNLKRVYPEAQIDYLIYPFTKPVLENNPNIDNIILFTDHIKNNKWEFIKFVWSIRKANYDIIIDAYGKMESALITLFSGANKRIGYKQKEKFFAYNSAVDHHDCPKTTDGLAIERRVNLFKDLMKGQKIDNLPKLFVSEHEKEKARLLFSKHEIDVEKKNIIMLSILGSEKDKTYPIPYLVELINFIASSRDVILLFNYMPKQHNEVMEIYKQCSKQAQSVINLEILGESLRSFMGIKSHCQMLIGNDGGAVNMAKALNKPTFTIFSPWIQKESWSIFEDGKFHKAVHLNDFMPEIIKSKSRKELKKKYSFYYEMFKPSLIFDSLAIFLETNLK